MTMQMGSRGVGFSLVVISLLGLTNTDVAASQEIATLVERADIVAVVHITAGTNKYIESIDNGCGYAYEAFVGPNIKGSREGDLVRFRTELPLTMSGSYLVFLSNDSDPRFEKRGSLGAHLQSQKCRKSGIELATMEYLSSELPAFGPALLMERRRRADEFGDRTYYFLGSLLLKDLYTEFQEYSSGDIVVDVIDVARPARISTELEVRSDQVLTILMRVADEK